MISDVNIHFQISSINNQGSNHAETCGFIYSANQFDCFYMMKVLLINMPRVIPKQWTIVSSRNANNT